MLRLYCDPSSVLDVPSATVTVVCYPVFFVLRDDKISVLILSVVVGGGDSAVGVCRG